MQTIITHNETGGLLLVDTGKAFNWDEPAGCSTSRGWLINEVLGACVGFYLDYGPDHYRTGHATDVGGGRIVSFCQRDRLCKDCQPGNILACRYPDGPHSDNKQSRYVETCTQAREYVERGGVWPA